MEDGGWSGVPRASESASESVNEDDNDNAEFDGESGANNNSEPEF